MDTPNNARSVAAYRRMFRDFDLLGRELAEAEYDAIQWALGSVEYSDVSTQRFIRLVEALEKGDRAGADQILRSWGIRR